MEIIDLWYEMKGQKGLSPEQEIGLFISTSKGSFSLTFLIVMLTLKNNNPPSLLFIKGKV
ncbi:MAG: hypothetical protein COS40_13775 [Deltaproteobacteria bacterium CG03_land_8_20_14_0_80_45_14]|nr:MAG: hypothetical protein COS40_13775 [Deltaproteobacteria bacterium CG03_land_8_20_14_0_80_45_14]